MLDSMADSKTSLKRKLSGSTDTGPKVSIVMPVYNAAPFIEASIESVIAQTYRPLELSIFVDASEDGTLEILVDLVPRLEARGVDVLISSHGFRDCIRRVSRDPVVGPDTEEHHARGAGYGRGSRAEVGWGGQLPHA
jgi:cellulose synthase/poly-beta-1,6-N-acetylglucosamine synthase-like glycosyltransferase